jgi:hypothetical protein
MRKGCYVEWWCIVAGTGVRPRLQVCLVGHVGKGLPKIVRSRIVEGIMIEMMIERYGNVTKAREVQSKIPDHSASISP